MFTLRKASVIRAACSSLVFIQASTPASAEGNLSDSFQLVSKPIKGNTTAKIRKQIIKTLILAFLLIRRYEVVLLLTKKAKTKAGITNMPTLLIICIIFNLKILSAEVRVVRFPKADKPPLVKAAVIIKVIMPVNNKPIKTSPPSKTIFMGGGIFEKTVSFVIFLNFVKKILLVKIDKILLGNFPLLLAPMEDVTDSVFRSICKEQGADVLFSEFISADGLVHDAYKSMYKINFKESERPYGVQIFGQTIPSLIEAAQIVESFKPDFIDLNFGCPVKKVVRRGGGAALLNDVPKMLQFTEAVIKSVSLPVTVKTRLGWDSKNQNIVEVAERLQDVGIKAISIHGRTKAQMYTGEADWTLIGEVKNNPRMNIPIFGNGDINSPEKALDYKNRYGVDGIMIGRASFGNPWIFKRVKHYITTGQLLPDPSISEKVKTCITYLQNSIALNGNVTGIHKMRRHYSEFFKAIPNFKPHRLELVTADSEEKIINKLREIEEVFG